MDNPHVSIVVPYYNHGKYIEFCLNSIFKSSFSDIEVILVNDSSTDKYSVDEFYRVNNKKVKKFTIPNGGPCSAKNFGVSKASGEIIGFLDADNEFLNDYIKEVVDRFENSQFDWVYGDAEYFGDETRVRKQKIKGKEELFINSPVDNCFFIKKEVFNQLGGFDENLNRLGLEDWEFILRLIIKDYKYFHIEKPLFRYRVLRDSRSNIEAKPNRKKIIKYVFDKHHETLFEYYSSLFFSKQYLERSLEVKIGKKLRALLGKS